MKVLIVYAHQEPASSFNAALLRRMQATLQALGHSCQVRDLYAMRFNPVATGDDFVQRADENELHYDLEQKAAAPGRNYAPDIKAELEELLAADMLVLQFPLYWFSVPAIMKGWIDRVFVDGVVYGDGRWYDRGRMAGKRAMIVMTTGCFPTMCGPDGINGNLDVMLWPLQNGVLRFVGFDVLPPFVAWAVAHKEGEARDRDLLRLDQRLHSLETTPALAFNPRSDFSPDWRLKPEAVAVAPGQQLALSPSHAANAETVVRRGGRT